MATKLKNLRVKRVDLVDNGASQNDAGTVGSHVVLFKAVGQVGKADLEELPQRVRGAFSARYNSNPFVGGGGYSSYVTVVEDAYVIACVTDQGEVSHYKIPWTEDAEGDINFEMDAREEVKQDWVAKATSFSEALMHRQMGDMTAEIGEMIGAFYEAVQSAISDGDEADKPAAVKRALAQFAEAIKGVVADWSVAKAGRKVSAARLKRLKDVKGHIDAIIAEAEATSAWVGKEAPAEPVAVAKRLNSEGGIVMDEKVLAGLPAEIQKAWKDLKAAVAKLTEDVAAAVGARDAAVGARDAAVADAKQAREQLAAAAPAKPEDIWKGVHPDVRKAHEAAVARAESAEALAKTERDERLKGVYISKAASFKGLPVKADDDWQVLKAVEEKLEPAQSKRIFELLKAGDEAVIASKAFAEIGRGGVPELGGAEAKINKLAEDVVAKSAAPITIEQARVRVMELHPELYAEHVRETRGED